MGVGLLWLFLSTLSVGFNLFRNSAGQDLPVNLLRGAQDFHRVVVGGGSGGGVSCVTILS